MRIEQRGHASLHCIRGQAARELDLAKRAGHEELHITAILRGGHLRTVALVQCTRMRHELILLASPLQELVTVVPRQDCTQKDDA